MIFCFPDKPIIFPIVVHRLPGVKPSKIETTIDDGVQRVRTLRRTSEPLYQRSETPYPSRLGGTGTGVVVVEIEGKEIPQEAGGGRYVHVLTSRLDKETAAFSVEERVVVREFVEV